MKEYTVQLTRGNLVYIQFGTGPVLLFFHGGIATPGAYQTLLRLLSKDFTVIAPTHPGHGNSFSIDDNWTIDDFIDTYREFMQKVGCKPKILFGHSLGGLFALLVSLHSVCQKLIVCDPAGLPFPGTPAAYLAAVFEEAQEAIKMRPDLTYIKNTLPTAGTIVHTAVRHGNDIPWFYTHVPRLNVSQELKKIHTPTTLFWGEKDKIIPVAVGKQMNDLIPLSQLIVFPQYGHVYPVTAPEHTFKEMQKAVAQ